jgi:hypothetical protein
MIEVLVWIRDYATLFIIPLLLLCTLLLALCVFYLTQIHALLMQVLLGRGLMQHSN